MDTSLFRKYINLMNETEDIDLTEDAILIKPNYKDFLVDKHTSNTTKQIFQNIDRFIHKQDLTIPIIMSNNCTCECCGKMIIMERSHPYPLCQACNEIILPNNNYLSEVIYNALLNELASDSTASTTLSGGLGYKIVELKNL